MANLRLRRLKIQKFRNVVPGTELVFSDGMNVLLGRNGTGKTTLLQLIAMITRSRFEPLVNEEFDIEYDVSLLDEQFRVLFSNRISQTSQDRVPREWRVSSVPPTEWSFRVSNLAPNGEEEVFLSGSPGRLTVGADWPDADIAFVRNPFERSPLDEAITVMMAIAAVLSRRSDDQKAALGDKLQWLRDFSDRAYLTQYQMAQHGGRFDEGLGTFGGIVNDPGFHSVSDAKGAMLLYRESDDWIGGQFVPADVISAAQQRIDSSGVADVSLSEAELPFLRRTLELIGGKEGKLILKLQKKKSPEDGGDATFGDFEFLITMDDGSVFRHDYLSYGQKRLLSFLYYAAANPDIIIADELVNGLHHEWIEACLDEIKDRQCFLTSQNPLLLDYLSFDSAEEVQRTFLLCDRQKEGKRTQLLWKHMDTDTAESFFRAYRAGLQHVSEILRTKGLW